MKALKLFSLVLLTSVVFLACKKDEVSSKSPSKSIEGVWVGQYGFGDDTPNIYYALNVKPGGVIEEINKTGQSKGSGTWTLVGNTFTAKYKWTILGQSTYSVHATLDPATGKLAGTWGYDNNPSDGGLFEISK
jgi:hypothetical protein